MAFDFFETRLFVDGRGEAEALVNLLTTLNKSTRAVTALMSRDTAVKWKRMDEGQAVNKKC